MSTFAEVPTSARFPSRYRDATSDLRLRVYDPTEEELPEWVSSEEVGDRLRAVVSWNNCVIPVEILRKWGVSTDELIATATDNLARLPSKADNLDREGVVIRATLGHSWVSSLITRLGDEAMGPEGAIAAIPHTGLLLTAPVVGLPTVDSLELMMLISDELCSSEGGLSPHVWWAWHGGLYRITDRQPDGTVDIETTTNASAFYFAGALEHLVHPCEECGRSRPAEGAVPSSAP